MSNETPINLIATLPQGSKLLWSKDDGYASSSSGINITVDITGYTLLYLVMYTTVENSTGNPVFGVFPIINDTSLNSGYIVDGGLPILGQYYRTVKIISTGLYLSVAMVYYNSTYSSSRERYCLPYAIYGVR